MPHERESEGADPPNFGPLVQYVFHNYFHLLTPDEKRAYADVVADLDIRRSDAVVAQFLAKGPKAFFEGVRDRVLAEHSGEVSLNRCPKCGALARTPTACLCPSCNHTWYELREKRAPPSFPVAATGQAILANLVAARPVPLF